MPRPSDPLGAARSTPRDHQYRIERLEKRLALAEAQAQARSAGNIVFIDGSLPWTYPVPWDGIEYENDTLYIVSDWGYQFYLGEYEGYSGTERVGHVSWMDGGAFWFYGDPIGTSQQPVWYEGHSSSEEYSSDLLFINGAMYRQEWGRPTADNVVKTYHGPNSYEPPLAADVTVSSTGPGLSTAIVTDVLTYYGDHALQVDYTLVFGSPLRITMDMTANVATTTIGTCFGSAYIEQAFAAGSVFGDYPDIQLIVEPYLSGVKKGDFQSHAFNGLEARYGWYHGYRHDYWYDWYNTQYRSDMQLEGVDVYADYNIYGTSDSQYSNTTAFNNITSYLQALCPSTHSPSSGTFYITRWYATLCDSPAV